MFDWLRGESWICFLSSMNCGQGWDFYLDLCPFASDEG
jgi:hypothetical protein